MSNLSPAARAVRDAFLTAPMGHSHVDDDQYGLAAALYALLQEKGAEIYDEDGRLVHFVVMQDDIRAIAAELEGAS